MAKMALKCTEYYAIRGHIPLYTESISRAVFHTQSARSYTEPLVYSGHIL